MKHIKGPDFPTGGIIMGRSGIHAAYATGRGKITLRAKTSIEEIKEEIVLLLMKSLIWSIRRGLLKISLIL